MQIKVLIFFKQVVFSSKQSQHCTQIQSQDGRLHINRSPLSLAQLFFIFLLYRNVPFIHLLSTDALYPSPSNRHRNKMPLMSPSGVNSCQILFIHQVSLSIISARVIGSSTNPSFLQQCSEEYAMADGPLTRMVELTSSWWKISRAEVYTYNNFKPRLCSSLHVSTLPINATNENSII